LIKNLCIWKSILVLISSLLLTLLSDCRRHGRMTWPLYWLLDQLVSCDYWPDKNYLHWSVAADNSFDDHFDFAGNLDNDIDFDSIKIRIVIHLFFCFDRKIIVAVFGAWLEKYQHADDYCFWRQILCELLQSQRLKILI